MEIENEAYGEPEIVEQKDIKQTAAVNLVSRLNNFRSYSDPGSIKGNHRFLAIRSYILSFPSEMDTF